MDCRASPDLRRRARWFSCAVAASIGCGPGAAYDALSGGAAVDGGQGSVDGGSPLPAPSATNDAAPPDGAAPTTPCGAAFSFCDDFERAAAAANGQWVVRVARGGILAIEPDATALSATRSLTIRLPGGAPAHDVRAYLSRAFEQPNTIRRVRVAFGMRLEHPALNVQLVTLSFPGNTFLLLEKERSTGRLHLAEFRNGAVPSKAFAAGAAPDGGWERYVVDFGFSDERRIVLYRAGVEIGRISLSPDPLGTVQSIGVGATFVEKESPPSTLRFDDVGLATD